MLRACGVALFLSVLLPGSAMADRIETAECLRDLAVAGQLVDGIAQRENSVGLGDFAGFCALLRRNLPEMIEARDIMDRCLTGHAHSENVGQMDVSIDDIRYALAVRCGGR